MTPAHLVAVSQWVVWVAQGTGMPSGADPETTIKTRAVMIGEKYSDTRMFCQASASFVALECGLMALPAVGILGKFLEKWWDRNKTAYLALPSPGMEALAHASLSGEDRAAVTVWLQHDQADDLSALDMTMRLSVIRRFNAPGFTWLIANNERAKHIAWDKGWLATAETDDFTDPGRILASVRNIVSPPHPLAGFWLRALRAAVERNAPQYLDLVPASLDAVVGETAERTPTPQQYADMRADEGIVRVPARPDPPDAPPDRAVLAQQFEAAHGRKLGALSPEQLKATREANPASAALLKAQQLGEAEALRKAPFPAPEGRTFDVEPEEDKPAPEDIKPGANYAANYSQPMPDGDEDDAEDHPDDSSAAPRDNVVPLYSPSWMQR